MDQSELQTPATPTDPVAEPAPKPVSPAAMHRLKAWSQRKPAIALMGEFSAGKSTLLNFLLRRQVLPTQVTATQLPPVWLSYGTADPYIMYNDGTRAPVDLTRLDDIPVTGTRFLRIFMEADILEAMDLIDTPGISDPNIPPEVWRRAAGYVNGVIWCTHATQAWRESERAAWVSLPERLRNHSLLLVTRADKLGEKDRQKVLRRVNREAGSLFAKSILFSALDAIRARDSADADDLWTKSGGEKFVDALFETTHDIINHKKQQLTKYKTNQNTAGIQIAANPRARRTKPGLLHAPKTLPAPSVAVRKPPVSKIAEQKPARDTRPMQVTGSNRKIWQSLIAKDQPETVDELVATIERFLIAVDNKSETKQQVLQA